MAKRGVPGSRNSQENGLASEPFGRNRGITGIVNTPEDDQRELIDRAQAGEATAFERLAEQYAAPVALCARPLQGQPLGRGLGARDAGRSVAILGTLRWSLRRVLQLATRHSTPPVLERTATAERRQTFCIGCSRPNAMQIVHARSFRGDVRRCPTDSPSGGELAGRASSGRRTAFLRGRNVGRDCSGSWLPVGDGEVATASRAEKVAANESYREPFHFGQGIERRANHE